MAPAKRASLPSSAPDGKRIAYSSQRPFGSTTQLTHEIFVATLGSSDPPVKATSFTTVPADAVSPTWHGPSEGAARAAGSRPHSKRGSR